MIRLVAGVFVQLFAASAAFAQQTQPSTTIDYLAPIGKPPPWNVRGSSDDQLLSTSALVDKHPVAIIVDTGVTFTALDTGWVTRAGLQMDAKSKVAMSASGGTAHAVLGPVVEIEAPPYRVKNLQTLAADLSGLSAVFGRAIDMALGMDVIGVGSLELDLGANRWRFGPTGLAWPQAATAPLRYTPDRYHNYIEIDVGGRPLRLGVDTGYNGGVMLTERAATLIGFSDSGRTTTIAAQGAGGLAVQRIAIVDRLRFGALTLTDVPIEVEEPNGLPTQWRLDGLVGVDLFRRLHAALDFRAGTMFYVASSVAPTPPVRSTIGLQMSRQQDGLSVVHVMANSPAANAGWKSGDRICAVNGASVANTPQSAGPNPWNLSPAGTRVTFTMCDGTSRSLKASNFY